jgi:hypothetical protein
VTNLSSLPKQWNEAAMRLIAERVDRPRSGWPLVGMLALGLVAGAAIGGYAVSQRAQLKRLSAYALGMGDGLDDMGSADDRSAADLTVPRSNHRRKATSEV